jgi:acetyl-CoA synthetase
VGATIVRDQVNDVVKGMGKPLVPKEIRFIREINKKCNAKVMRRIIRAAYLGEGPGDPSALANPAVVDEIRQTV